MNNNNNNDNVNTTNSSSLSLTPFTSVLTVNELEQIQQAKVALGLAAVASSDQIPSNFQHFNNHRSFVKSEFPLGLSGLELPMQRLITMEEEAQINQQISRKRSLSTSSISLLPHDLAAFGDVHGHIDEDSASDALIKPHELSNLNAFFDHELDTTTTNDGLDQFALFNNEEHQVLMQFLDRFLEADDDPMNLRSSAPNVFPSIVNYTQPEPISTLSNALPVIPEVEEPSIPGTVAIPVIAPRKKRHSSKELLTEQERRANHIASEQKRRRNIKAGFEALQRLVPSLSHDLADTDADEASDSSATITDHQQHVQHQFKRRRISNVQTQQETACAVTSKGYILTKAIEYLQHLTARNERLLTRYLNLKHQQDSIQRNVNTL